MKSQKAKQENIVTEQANKLAGQESKIAEFRAIIEGSESRTSEAEKTITRWRMKSQEN